MNFIWHFKLIKNNLYSLQSQSISYENKASPSTALLFVFVEKAYALPVSYTHTHSRKCSPLYHTWLCVDIYECCSGCSVYYLFNTFRPKYTYRMLFERLYIYLFMLISQPSGSSAMQKCRCRYSPSKWEKIRIGFFNSLVSWDFVCTIVSTVDFTSKCVIKKKTSSKQVAVMWTKSLCW